MEHSENISVFNIVGALYGNIHMGIFIILEHYMGILQGIFSDYSRNTSWECSMNIPRTHVCPVGSTFQKIVDGSNRKPNKQWVDKDSEFYINSFYGSNLI